MLSQGVALIFAFFTDGKKKKERMEMRFVFLALILFIVTFCIP